MDGETIKEALSCMCDYCVWHREKAGSEYCLDCNVNFKTLQELKDEGIYCDEFIKSLEKEEE